MGLLHYLQNDYRADTINLVYMQEEVMLVEYIVPSLRIAAAIGMDDEGALEERLA